MGTTRCLQISLRASSPIVGGGGGGGGGESWEVTQAPYWCLISRFWRDITSWVLYSSQSQTQKTDFTEGKMPLLKLTFELSLVYFFSLYTVTRVKVKYNNNDRVFFVLKFLKEINTSQKKNCVDCYRVEFKKTTVGRQKNHRDENLFSPVWELKNSRHYRMAYYTIQGLSE